MKKLCWFVYSKNMANFEAYRWDIISEEYSLYDFENIFIYGLSLRIPRNLDLQVRKKVVAILRTSAAAAVAVS